MYEIKITAESIGELKGRIFALAAELSAAAAPTTGYVSTRVAASVGAPKAEEPKAEEPKAEEPKAEKPKAEEPKAEEPKAEEPKAAEPKAAEPEQADPEAEAAAPTYEQVRSAVLRVSLVGGRDAVNTILNHFGATKNAQEIDPSRYPEVIEMANKMLEG